MKWRERPEAVETLRKLAARGWSAGDIALEFDEAEGLTKNAIIGAARRLGIELKYKPPQGPPRPRKRYRKRPKMTAPAQPPKPEPAPEPAPSAPCTIIDLTNQSCRWLLTDSAPWTYCGSPEADLTGGRAYCREHSRVAYGRRAT